MNPEGTASRSANAASPMATARMSCFSKKARSNCTQCFYVASADLSFHYMRFFLLVI
jgi:hypothetical protein